ncbi:hypothetical protein YH65_06680 [Sulfurovum lithotrophicum]|uniref:PKD domain-containing protein n=1 Tax=Sulfurovum lithotrophicum TaxID=206403 RepID=A0A7U4M1J1_9BACT|nr:PKD domain-containing protein [Sulfurovum lithotrophicum]AKF25112.1 hypothetical protein YH65_06680 [Sulfurovum lithotrophicum]
MKYINRKTVIALISGAVVLGLSGCETEGISSDTQLVGSAKNIPPVAVAKVIPSEVTIGDTVTADGSESYDPDGTIVSYVWKIQDIIIGSGMTEDVSTEDLAAGTYTVTLVVTDNNGATATDNTQVTLVEPEGPTCLETAGFGTITLANGQEWLDRNLGANKVADDENDSDAIGDLYQWGRAADGHEKRDSETTMTKATTIESNSSDSWYGKFIIEDIGSEAKTVGTFPHASGYVQRAPDWVAYDVDNNGSLRYVGWKSTDKVSSTQVCPCGYVVPSAQDYMVLTRADTETLHFETVGGHRNYEDGSLSSPDEWAYWTRNPDYGSPDISLVFWGNGEGDMIAGLPREYGLEVRCINPATSKPYIPENEPPVAKAGDDHNISICETLILDGSESNDPDGTIVSYEWFVWSDGNMSHIDNGPTIQLPPSINRTNANEHTFTLRVTDNDGATSEDNITITVQAEDSDYDFSYIINDPAAQPTSPYLTVTPDNANIYEESEFHYWATTTTNSDSETPADPGNVTFDFSFPGNIEIAYLTARITTFHFSYSAGTAYLYTANGGDWNQLLYAETPAINGYNIQRYNDFLENARIGTKNLSIRAELHADGSSYQLTAQFLRWRDDETSFKLNICYEDTENGD